MYLLFLISCVCTSCSPQCHQWKFSAIKADCPPATYVKTYLPASNPFSGIETQLLCENGKFVLYFDVITLQFPASTSSSLEQTEVKISVNDQDYCFFAERLKGGQRLLLPDDATQFIICSLLEGNCVDVVVGRYQSTLSYEGFSKTYDQLVAVSFPK